MKLLLFDAEYFWYKTFKKTLEDVEDIEKEEKIENTAVVFIHVESKDEEKKTKVINRTVRNLRWYLNKIENEIVVLHSFAHLSSSKSSPEFAVEVFKVVKEKLEKRGIKVHITPFGYFNEFSIHVRGESLAKVFQEI
jgi:hypothetical protein